jgi:nucleotide-binding universal stress UspA family protein
MFFPLTMKVFKSVVNMSRLHSPFSVLLAVDGSEHSLAAAQLLGDLPLPTGSSVMMVGILTPRHTPDQAVLFAALDNVRAILRDGGVEAKAELLHGQPVKELIRFADECKPDLIVVGATGLYATPGTLLGEVSQHVVWHAHQPVLVVRAPYQGLRRVLLATSGSPHSVRTLNYLARFPLSAETTVELMHVLPPLPPPVLYAYPVEIRAVLPESAVAKIEQAADQQARAEEREGQMLLERTARGLKAARVEAATALRRGDAAAEIIGHVKAHAIDLIVAGSDGVSRVKARLLGSVSHRLVHHAGCSVLIVRAANLESWANQG